MLCHNIDERWICQILLLSISATHSVGLPAALVALLLGIVINRVLDHYTDQNVKMLKELITIRKEMSSPDANTAKMDEIITYRRKRYLKRQVDAFEKLKKEDRKEADKAAAHTNTFAKWLYKISWNSFVLGTIELACLVTVLVYLSELFV